MESICYMWNDCSKYLHMKPRENVGSLRRQLSRRTGVPASELRLKCGDRDLRDGDLINSIAATVLPMLRLPAGGMRAIRGPGASNLQRPRGRDVLPALTPITGGGISDAGIATDDVGPPCLRCDMPAPDFSVVHPDEDCGVIFGYGLCGGTCGKRFLPGTKQDASTLKRHQHSSMCCSVQKFTNAATKSQRTRKTEPERRSKVPLIQGLYDHVMDLVQQQTDKTANYGIVFTPENGWEVPLAMLKDGALRTSFLDLLGKVSANRGSNDPEKGFISSGSEQYQGMILAGACQPP